MKSNQLGSGISKSHARQGFYDYMLEANGEGGTAAGYRRYMSEHYADEIEGVNLEFINAALSKYWTVCNKTAKFDKPGSLQIELHISGSPLQSSMSIPTDIPGQYVHKSTLSSTIEETQKHIAAIKLHAIASMQKYELLSIQTQDALEIADGDNSWTWERVLKAKKNMDLQMTGT